MKHPDSNSPDWEFEGSTLKVRIPMRLQRRAGRKQIVTHDDSQDWASKWGQPKSSIIRALGRAHRWRRLLEDGNYATIAELCQTEKITDSFAGRILQLNLLAPEIVEQLLDGVFAPTLTLAEIVSIQPLWQKQRDILQFHKS